jgi:hypothetical protein
VRSWPRMRSTCFWSLKRSMRGEGIFNGCFLCSRMCNTTNSFLKIDGTRISSWWPTSCQVTQSSRACSVTTDEWVPVRCD